MLLSLVRRAGIGGVGVGKYRGRLSRARLLHPLVCVRDKMGMRHLQWVIAQGQDWV